MVHELVVVVVVFVRATWVRETLVVVRGWRGLLCEAAPEQELSEPGKRKAATLMEAGC